MLKSLPGLAILVGVFVLVTGGSAQDTPAAPKTQRAVYTVRSGDAAALAEAVTRHYQGEATVLTVPAGAGQALLIRAAEPTTAEILKLLEQLDRGPAPVEIDVYLVDVFAKQSPFVKDPAETDWSGPADQILARLDELSKNSRTGSVQRFRLATVEGKLATATTGGNKPLTVGSVAKGGFPGGATKSIQYFPTGTTIQATPRVGVDGSIAIDLDLKETRVRAPEPAAAGAGDEAAETMTGTLTSRITVPPGRAVAAQAVRTEGKAGGTIALVIVTARVPAGGK